MFSLIFRSSPDTRFDPGKPVSAFFLLPCGKMHMILGFKDNYGKGVLHPVSLRSTKYLSWNKYDFFKSSSHISQQIPFLLQSFVCRTFWKQLLFCPAKQQKWMHRGELLIKFQVLASFSFIFVKLAEIFNTSVK